MPSHQTMTVSHRMMISEIFIGICKPEIGKNPSVVEHNAALQDLTNACCSSGDSSAQRYVTSLLCVLAFPPRERILFVHRIIRGVGGVLEVVRPKVGAAEGRVGGGSGGPPPGKFCKKTQNPAFWELLAHFTHTSGAVCMQSSRVQ